MIREEKLDFWLKNNQNVLLIGKHGVGKSTMVLEAFKRAKLKYLYFSGSTMDPFVDFCGVPIKTTDSEGHDSIELILPKYIDANSIEAIFIDEYNRCLTGDTKIQLADGTFSEIKDLVGKEEFHVFSFDIENNAVRIGKGHSARLTGENKKIYKVILDNGSTIKCTGNHPFLLSNGTYVNADRLKENDSLMCLFKKNNEKGYELVSATKQTKWTPTYRLSDLYNIENGVYEENGIQHRHHIDFNKNNNSPRNIARFTRSEHLGLHGNNKEFLSNSGKMNHIKNPDLVSRTIGRPESKKKALENSIKTRSTSVAYKQIRSELSKKMYTDDMREHRSGITKKQWGSGQFNKINRKEALRKTHTNKTINILKSYGYSPRDVSFEKYEEIRGKYNKEKNGNGRGLGLLKEKTIISYFGSFGNFIMHWESKEHEQCQILNHRVLRIEDGGCEDVYDISVEKYHNFAIESGVFVHNSHRKIINATMELIQFKSINGKKFPKLRVVWAAINPEKTDDEETDYAVEALDPAHKDRFQIHCEIPYACDLKFFKGKYGSEMAEAAIEWWGQMDKGAKDKVSPRRLDYALEFFSAGGELKDILPKECNTTLLATNLASGSVQRQLLSIMEKNDEEEGRRLVNNLTYKLAIERIVRKNLSKYASFVIPLMSPEQLTSFISSTKDRGAIKDILVRDMKEKKEKSDIFKALSSLSASKKNKDISKFARDIIMQSNLSGVTGPSSTADQSVADILTRMSNAVQTYERVRAYEEMSLIPEGNLSKTGVLARLQAIDLILSRTQSGTLTSYLQYQSLPGFIATTIRSLMDKHNVSEQTIRGILSTALRMKGVSGYCNKFVIPNLTSVVGTKI